VRHNTTHLNEVDVKRSVFVFRFTILIVPVCLLSFVITKYLLTLYFSHTFIYFSELYYSVYSCSGV